MDKNLNITSYSHEIQDTLNASPAVGDSVLDYLDEFMGYEDDILKIFINKAESIKLETIQRGEKYYNIYVDYYDDKNILILLQNVTDTARSQQKALQGSNQTLLLYVTLQKIIDGQNTLIFLANHQNELEFTNKRFLDYFHIGQNSIDKNNLKIYKLASEELNSYSELYEYIQTREKHININDETFAISAANIDTSHMLFSLSEVTNIFREKSELVNELQTDNLTGVYRKKYFIEEISKWINNNLLFYLAVIDLDNFKQINDNYGHLVGDAVLKQFSQILKDVCKESDLLARWGGDEFLFAFEAQDKQSAIKRIKSLQGLINNFKFRYGQDVSASFGITYRNLDDRDINIIISSADKALYDAKRSGKDRVMFKNTNK